MVTSYDNYCVVGEPPANHTNSVSESSNSTDEADEVNGSDIVKVYYLNVVEGEMSEDERDALPDSFKTACQGKPIQKTKKVVVDEATFNQDNFDSVEGVRAVARQSGCSNQKVKKSSSKLFSKYFIVILISRQAAQSLTKDATSAGQIHLVVELLKFIVCQKLSNVCLAVKVRPLHHCVSVQQSRMAMSGKNAVSRPMHCNALLS